MDSSSKPQTNTSKNWLIRTKQKQILGPVSKEKLISFVEKGALGPEDEVMSGNGYWFSLKERELLDKYVLGDIPQSFDPISEAKTVLSISQERKEGTSSMYPNPSPLKWENDKIPEPQEPTLSSDEQDIKLPDDGDLAYPSLGDVAVNELSLKEDLDAPDFGDLPPDEDDEPQTQVINLDKLEPQKALSDEDESEDDEEDENLPDEDDLEYPDLSDVEVVTPKIQQDDEVKKTDSPPKKTKSSKSFSNASETSSSQRKKRVVEAPKRNDRYLFYILALVILLTLGVFYYYKKILNKPFPLVGVLVSSANAQSLVQDPSGLKKKEFLDLYHYRTNSITEKSA